MEGKSENPQRRVSGVTAAGLLMAVLMVGAALQYGLNRRRGPVPADPVVIRSWYPQPEVLLQNRDRLQLTSRQVRQVHVADREWQIQKAAYDAQLRSYGSDAERGLAEIARGTSRSGRYGDLLHDFDAARDAAWKKCTEKLLPEQILQLDSLHKKPE